MISSKLSHPSNKGSLRRRFITATVGIPALLLIVIAGPSWVLVLAVTATLLGLMEFFRLANVQRFWFHKVPSLALGSLMILLGWNNQTFIITTLAVATPLVLLLSYRMFQPSIRPPLLALIGPMYLGATLAHGPLLRRLDDGTSWLLLPILASFAVDTTAYFTGTLIGRHKIAPKLSPGKTWEGTVAGIAGGVIATTTLIPVLGLEVSFWASAFLGTTIGVVAILGDLLESGIKRMAQMKDAGSIIPGHGGLLDRLDSIMFNLIVVYHFASWTIL